MERCFAPVLASNPPDRSARLDETLLPQIVLDPPPASWPDPSEFVREEE
jgi:hypothetical protein